MPHYVVLIDTLGILLAISGFFLAFRQTFVRRVFNLPDPHHDMAGDDMAGDPDDDPDALTYVLRLSGVMMMLFGLALTSMFTLFNLASTGAIH